VAVEVWRGEERRSVVLDQCLLLGLRRHPKDDHVQVALPGLGVDRIGTWGAEEHERSPTDLVDRVAARAVHDGDVRHARRELMHILDPRPARALDHRKERRAVRVATRYPSHSSIGEWSYVAGSLESGRTRPRRMQNSLPSGSASTTHDASRCPTAARRAPRERRRSTSAV